MLVAPLLSLSFSASIAPKLHTDDPSAQRALFSDFKARYSKSYADADEEAVRLRNFVSFLALADERNAASPTAQHGITQFADLTQAEFKAQYLTGGPSAEVAAAPAVTVRVQLPS